MIKKALLTTALLSTALLANADDFTFSSNDIAANSTLKPAQVANVFGCSGGNISPELHWKNPPKGTKSFALTVYDPDAPTGSGFWHWMVINIPKTTSHLVSGAGDVSKNKLPKGAQQLRSDYGFNGFGGACPPKGDKPHRYEFTLYALDTDNITLAEGATTAVGGFMIHAHTLAKVGFTAYFGR